MPAYLLAVTCLKIRQISDPTTVEPGRPLADCIIQALEKSNIAEICHAIGADTRLQQHLRPLRTDPGLRGRAVYRAFAGGSKHPDFTTVLNALDAMGFRLHVAARRDAPATAARALKPVAICQGRCPVLC
jgi:DNA-binding phage protein